MRCQVNQVHCIVLQNSEEGFIDRLMGHVLHLKSVKSVHALDILQEVGELPVDSLVKVKKRSVLMFSLSLNYTVVDWLDLI